MGWFGPRGLNSLLLALLAVQAAAPDAEHMMAITGAVVVVSVIAHGVTATPLASVYAHRVATAEQTLAEERESTFAGLFNPDADEIIRITPEILAMKMAMSPAPYILDVRSRAHYENDAGQIPGSIRVLPDQIEDWASSVPADRPAVAYCTCPDEAASGRVSRFLESRGFHASALKGGYKAWEAEYPIEPKGSVTIPALAL
jgi:rhodanese-related sulfurtransferase